MDYQWTNRSPVKPVWASTPEDLSTPRKRMYRRPHILLLY